MPPTGSSFELGAERLRTVRHDRDAKVTQEEMALLFQKDILGLEIAMDDFLLMRELQGRGELFDIGHHLGKRNG